MIGTMLRFCLEVFIPLKTMYAELIWNSYRIENFITWLLLLPYILSHLGCNLQKRWKKKYYKKCLQNIFFDQYLFVTIITLIIICCGVRSMSSCICSQVPWMFVAIYSLIEFTSSLYINNLHRHYNVIKLDIKSFYISSQFTIYHNINYRLVKMDLFYFHWFPVNVLLINERYIFIWLLNSLFLILHAAK